MFKKKLKYLRSYLKYKDKIYSYFWYRTGGRQEVAEDLTQEVFLKAWKEYHHFLEGRPFQSWIYRIAHNHLIDYYRTSKKNYKLDDMTRSLSAKDNKTFELKQLLDQLPEREREIIILKYIFGYNYEEIGEMTNQSKGSARVTAHRALKKLRIKNSEEYEVP